MRSLRTGPRLQRFSVSSLAPRPFPPRFLCALGFVAFLLALGSSSRVAAQPYNLLPAAADFGATRVGSTAEDYVVRLTNLGPGTFESFRASGDLGPFSGREDCSRNMPIGLGEYCEIGLDFEPYEPIPFATTLGIEIQSSTGELIEIDLPIRGEGTYDPQVRIWPPSVDFGSVKVGDFISDVTVHVTNIGRGDLPIFTGGGVPTPFSGSKDCGGLEAIPHGGGCKIYYSFVPPSAGLFSTTSATNWFSIDLFGVGDIAPDVLLEPGGVDFGEVALGTELGVVIVTVTNLGSVEMTGFSGGVPGSPFSALTDCNDVTPIPVGGSCEYYYSFEPMAAGAVQAESMVTFTSSQGGGGSFTVPLFGEGVAEAQVLISHPEVSFGAVPVGVTTARLPIVITNTGLGEIESLTHDAVHPDLLLTKECTDTPGLLFRESCKYLLRYQPSGEGALNTEIVSEVNGASHFVIPVTGVPEPASAPQMLAAWFTLMSFAGLKRCRAHGAAAGGRA